MYQLLLYHIEEIISRVKIGYVPIYIVAET